MYSAHLQRILAKMLVVKQKPWTCVYNRFIRDSPYRLQNRTCACLACVLSEKKCSSSSQMGVLACRVRAKSSQAYNTADKTFRIMYVIFPHANA